MSCFVAVYIDTFKLQVGIAVVRSSCKSESPWYVPCWICAVFIADNVLGIVVVRAVKINAKFVADNLLGIAVVRAERIYTKFVADNLP